MKHLISRFLTISICLALFASSSVTAFAAGGVITTEEELRETLNNPAISVLVLGNDAIELISGEALTVPANRKCTIRSGTGSPVVIKQMVKEGGRFKFRHFDFYDVENVEITFDNVVLDGEGEGGGICVSGDSFVTFTNAVIKNCTSTGYFGGGGVYVGDVGFNGKYGTFTANNCEITGNAHFSEDFVSLLPAGVYIPMGGGGVSVDGMLGANGEKFGATFNMNGGKISGNYSYDGGGGLFVAGTFNMNGGEISNNRSLRGSGIRIFGNFKGRDGNILNASFNRSGNCIITDTIIDTRSKSPWQ